ncbi:MAG: hypothetical protein R3E12_01430 [Candidatus Eisenbacteria bacterium]
MFVQDGDSVLVQSGTYLEVVTTEKSIDHRQRRRWNVTINALNFDRRSPSAASRVRCG